MASIICLAYDEVSSEADSHIDQQAEDRNEWAQSHYLYSQLNKYFQLVAFS